MVEYELWKLEHEKRMRKIEKANRYAIPQRPNRISLFLKTLVSLLTRF